MRLIVALLLIVSTPAFGDSTMPPSYWAYRQLTDATKEARARALMEELRCLVCQGQSIADSDAEIAGDMRDLVRRRIAAGEDPEAIRGWLIERYGAWVSYRPQSQPLTWPLWAVPVLCIAAGGLLLRRRIRFGAGR